MVLVHWRSGVHAQRSSERQRPCRLMEACMTEAISRDPIYRRRRYPPGVIELCVRWYITYRLSYRDLVAMMAERGVTVRDGRYLNNTVEQDHLLSVAAAETTSR